MEDLTLRGARFPNATGELALDSLRDRLANLSRMVGACQDLDPFELLS